MTGFYCHSALWLTVRQCIHQDLPDPLLVRAGSFKVIKKSSFFSYSSSSKIFTVTNFLKVQNKKHLARYVNLYINLTMWAKYKVWYICICQVCSLWKNVLFYHYHSNHHYHHHYCHHYHHHYCHHYHHHYCHYNQYCTMEYLETVIIELVC